MILESEVTMNTEKDIKKVAKIMLDEMVKRY